jgi:hypothetical protein
MAEILIDSSELLVARAHKRDEVPADVRALVEGLRAAIPEYEPRVDERVFEIGSVPRRARGLTATGMWFDVIGLVLPGATAVLVKAAVDVVVDRLRGLVKHRGDEKFVLIFDPNGERLRMVRLRGEEEPDVVEPPWPTLEDATIHRN